MSAAVARYFNVQIHFLFVFYDDDDKWLFTIKDSSMRLVDKAYLQAI